MTQNIELRNGFLMPQLAIGTAFVDDPEAIRQSIAIALKIGYQGPQELIQRCTWLV